ncbi:MAG TPA: PKD domain-containing protein [Bacteroidia bacterium]|nr:PKD domain-containing protein [Bacteroidia bacterium]
MKNFNLLILYSAICLAGNNSFGQVNGCTDPQANNYNASATINNGSCTYNVTNLSLTNKTALSTPLLDETSGVEFLSNKLWTFNDSGNSNAIYRVDTATNTVHQTVTISNATNTDWEDMTSNNDYLFIGDFGNNNGNRQNLKIYRIHKNNLPAGATTATADVINFSYSDQTSFPSLPNNNNFDCESMIFYNDSIHLFSKNWVDLQTRHYVLPNAPGTHVAQYRETLNAGYMVTGASVQKGGVIALIGYNNSGSGPIYVYMLYDHKNNFFFNGNKRRFNVGDKATYGQVEAVDFFNAAYAYISNEKYTSGSTIFPRLRTFNLAAYLPNAFVFPKPKSQFVVNTTSICANSSVTFTDQSENNPTTWQWSFPGGTPSTSTSQNPVVQYAVAGIYNVTLVASNATGNDTLIKTSYITVNAKPAPLISGTLSFCGNSSTTLDAGAGYTSYLWSTTQATQAINVSNSNTYTVTVTNNNGCTGSASVSTNALPTPVPVIIGALSFCTGSSTVLSEVSGWQSYLWSTGATTPSITVTTAGNYSVVVTDVNGCTGVEFISTTVKPLPIATTSPSGNVTTCSLSQTLAATYGVGYSFQWRLNSGNITGATSISYNATASGDYDVVVTESGCSSTSAGIILTLGTGATASITGSATFCAGSGNILTANTGSGITYQWYRNTVLQNGATSSTFNANSTGTYYVIENSSCGTAQSNSIVVTQINNPNATISYTTPLSFCAPGSVVLTSSTFSGVSYQWQKNSVDIAGATSQNYSATSNGTYRVRQTANGCFKYSPAVSVTTAASVTATITANGPVTFCTGGSVVLSVSNAVPGYGYQWKNNGVNISNATSSSYTATTPGSFTCTVTANCGTATSNAIVVSTGGITASVNPSGAVTICSGAVAALSANTGTNYTFQWKRNGTNITGATNSTYGATIAGSYTVAITSPCGNATSAATTVSIGNVTATISPSGSPTICAGSAQTFTANTGYNFAYQWFRNGVALAGATSSTYATSNYGSYTVRVTQGGVCSATSVTSVLSVTNNPTPTVTPQGPTAFCAGQSVVLQANSFAGVVFQWQKNGIDIAGAINQNYTATTAGSYRVKQTANGCTKSSATVTVTVNCREAGVGMAEKEESNLRVMPNPFTNELIVTGMTFNAGDRADLIDVLGKTVLQYIVTSSSQNLQLKTLNIKPGVYFLNVITSVERKTVKVVRE